MFPRFSSCNSTFLHFVYGLSPWPSPSRALPSQRPSLAAAPGARLEETLQIKLNRPFGIYLCKRRGWLSAAKADLPWHHIFYFPCIQGIFQRYVNQEWGGCLHCLSALIHVTKAVPAYHKPPLCSSHGTWQKLWVESTRLPLCHLCRLGHTAQEPLATAFKEKQRNLLLGKRDLLLRCTRPEPRHCGHKSALCKKKTAVVAFSLLMPHLQNEKISQVANVLLNDIYLCVI